MKDLCHLDLYLGFPESVGTGISKRPESDRSSRVSNLNVQPLEYRDTRTVIGTRTSRCLKMGLLLKNSTETVTSSKEGFGGMMDTVGNFRSTSSIQGYRELKTYGRLNHGVPVVVLNVEHGRLHHLS